MHIKFPPDTIRNIISKHFIYKITENSSPGTNILNRDHAMIVSFLYIENGNSQMWFD